MVPSMLRTGVQGLLQHFASDNSQACNSGGSPGPVEGGGSVDRPTLYHRHENMRELALLMLLRLTAVRSAVLQWFCVRSFVCCAPRVKVAYAVDVLSSFHIYHNTSVACRRA